MNPTCLTSQDQNGAVSFQRIPHRFLFWEKADFSQPPLYMWPYVTSLAFLLQPQNSACWFLFWNGNHRLCSLYSTFFFFFTTNPILMEKEVIFPSFLFLFIQKNTFSMFRIYSLGFTHNHIRVIKVKNELGKISKSMTIIYQPLVDSSSLPSERIFGSCNVFLPSM